MKEHKHTHTHTIKRTCTLSAALIFLGGAHQFAVEVLLPVLSKPHVPPVVLQSPWCEVRIEPWKTGQQNKRGSFIRLNSHNNSQCWMWQQHSSVKSHNKQVVFLNVWVFTCLSVLHLNHCFSVKRLKSSQFTSSRCHYLHPEKQY